MFELYWAYADYHDMRALVEGLLRHLANQLRSWAPDDPKIHASTERFQAPFATIDFVDELEQHYGIPDVLERRIETSSGNLPDRSDPPCPTTLRAASFSTSSSSTTWSRPSIDQPLFLIIRSPLLLWRNGIGRGPVESSVSSSSAGFRIGQRVHRLNDPEEQDIPVRERTRGAWDRSLCLRRRVRGALRPDAPGDWSGLGCRSDRNGTDGSPLDQGP